MVETCKMCGDFATPYYYIKELNGHICDNCGHILTNIEQEFEVMIERLGQRTTPEFDQTLEDAVSPRTIKKGLYATIRKWCNMHFIKRNK